MPSHAPTWPEAERIVRLATPLAFTQLAQVAMSTTDVVMMGWLGDEALAAGGLGFFLFNLLRTMGFGLVVGTSNLIAADRKEEVSRAHVHAALLVASVAAGIAALLMLFGTGLLVHLGQDPRVVETTTDYLAWMAPGMFPCFWFYAYRGVAVGRRKANGILAITIAAVFLNAALDYAFGLPALGVPGVAAATSACFLFQFAAVAILTHRTIGFERGAVRLRRLLESARRLLAIGIPTAASYGSEAGFTAAISLLMGAFGAATLAAHAIVNQITYVVFMLSIGLSHATSVGVSEAVGAGERERALGVGRTGFIIGAGLMMVFSVLYLLIPDWLLLLFSMPADSAPAVRAVALALLPVAAAFQIFDCLQNVAIGALRGVNRAAAGFWITIASYWVVGLPAAWLFGRSFGPAGTWSGLAIGLVTAAGALMLAFEYFARQRTFSAHQAKAAS